MKRANTIAKVNEITMRYYGWHDCRQDTCHHPPGMLENVEVQPGILAKTEKQFTKGMLENVEVQPGILAKTEKQFAKI